MNFNYSKKPEYQLHSRIIDEAINLYGVPVTFVYTKKIIDKSTYGTDEDFNEIPSEASVFGDYTSIKSTGAQEYKINVLLAENDGFPNGLDFAFNAFGVQNEDTLQVFVSLKSLCFLNENCDIKEGIFDGSTNIVHPKHIISNLIVFPNGKCMEITDVAMHVEGRNNLFVYTDLPSCYKLSLKRHNFDNSASSVIKDKGMATGFTQNSKEFIENADLTVENPANILDNFFENHQQINNQTQQAAKNPVKKVKAFEKVEVPGAKIDDVFGTY